MGHGGSIAEVLIEAAETGGRTLVALGGHPEIDAAATRLLELVIEASRSHGLPATERMAVVSAVAGARAKAVRASGPLGPAAKVVGIAEWRRLKVPPPGRHSSFRVGDFVRSAKDWGLGRVQAHEGSDGRADTFRVLWQNGGISTLPHGRIVPAEHDAPESWAGSVGDWIQS